MASLHPYQTKKLWKTTMGRVSEKEIWAEKDTWLFHNAMQDKKLWARK